MDLEEIQFHKYQAAGDDFIVIDNRDGRYTQFLASPRLIRALCRRHYGVDTDGIIEVKRDKSQLEFAWHTCLGITNTVCGNGCRVFSSYVIRSGIHTGNDDVTFLAGDGMHRGNYDAVTQEGWASIGDVLAATVDQISPDMYFANTGLPHLIVYVDYDVRTIDDVMRLGDSLSDDWNWSYGTKTSRVVVTFVHEEGGVLYGRCCNRNLGKENLSCGTATAAITISKAVRSGCAVDSDFSARIQWPGGLMKCSLHRESSGFSQIQISGPVRQVFKGTFYTNSLKLDCEE